MWADATLEAGLDARTDRGEDRETYGYVDGALSRMRRAGGATFVGGAYTEATDRLGRLLLAAGARIDDWQTFDGHDIESAALEPSQGVDTRNAQRGGVVPSGRVAARYDLTEALWLRTAAYAGFRPPTLNELFRTYRVGSNLTKADADLTPEQLYGGEGGAGGSAGPLSWALTMFYNRLVDPVTNVTLAYGPYSDPVAGLVPAGGALLQRRNVGAVDAFGMEGEAALRLGPSVRLQAAVDWTHARVDGGTAAPNLDGLQPAETPSAVATAQVEWKPVERLRLLTSLRHETQRYVDDLNKLRLAPDTVVGARVEFSANRRLTVFLAADNLFDANVQQNESTLGLYSYGAPRIVSVGLRLRGL